MKMTALQFGLVASALVVGFAACTVTTDDTSTDGGTGGGSTGGTGGATGGTGGAATGGTAGSATGGTAGSATGGSAGSATGGSGGGAQCSSTDPADTCGTCLATGCCDQYLACSADTQCTTSFTCFSNCTGDLQTCATDCDQGNFNVPFNDFIDCLNTKCLTECSG